MLSKACEHGIKAMIYIATHSEDKERVKLGDIASNTNSPEAFTAKVLGALSKANLLESFKGPFGGFALSTAQAKAIHIKDIVKAIDGNALFEACVLGLNECNAQKPCPIHHQFVKVRVQLEKVLNSTTLFDLTKDLKAGDTFLKR